MARKKPYDISKLKPQDVELARVLIENEMKPRRERLTVKEICEQVGISEHRYRKMKHDENFVAYFDEIVETFMNSELAFAYGQLMRRVGEGNTKAIELFLKSRGKLVDKKDVTMYEDETESAEERQKRLLERLEELAKEAQEKEDKTE